MSTLCLGHPLTFVRAQHGWTTRGFPILMNNQAKSMGLSLAHNRGTTHKWEHGQTPDKTAQRVLASLLGLEDSDWSPEDWPNWLPVGPSGVLGVPWSATGTVDLLTTLSRTGHMDRRRFVTITGAALGALAAGWADAPGAFAAASNGDRVTATMVDSLDKRVQALRELDAEMGGGKLLADARQDFKTISSVIANGRYTEAIGIRLHRLAAQVSYMVGWMSYDTGLLSAGQSYYTGALYSAKAAGDDAFGAFVLVDIGVLGGEVGHLNDRLSMTATALAGAPKNMPPQVESYLTLSHAGSLREIGDHRSAAKALAKAETLLDRAVSDDDLPAYLGWFGETTMESSRGKLLVSVGHYDEASEALERSVAKAAPRDAAVRSARLAEVRLMGRNLDGALEAAHQGLALLEGAVSSSRAVNRLYEFADQLSGHSAEPSVVEFRERLDAVRQAA